MFLLSLCTAGRVLRARGGPCRRHPHPTTGPSCTISPSSSSYPATSKCSCNTYKAMLGSTTHGSLCLETPRRDFPAENFKIKRVIFYPVLLHCLKNCTSITWGKVPKIGLRIYESRVYIVYSSLRPLASQSA